MKMIAAFLLSVCLCLVSVGFAQEPVAYANYDNSSTAIPLEHDPHKMGVVTPMILQHGNSDGDSMHSENMMHSHPMEAELDTEGPSEASNSSSSDSSDFLNMSSTDFGDTNSTEQEGPSTKATHVMVIPRKNMTAVDGDNTTDSSMDKEASAATSEHGTHSKGAGSSASVIVVLALFTLSSRVLLSQ